VSDDAHKEPPPTDANTRLPSADTAIEDHSRLPAEESFFHVTPPFNDVQISPPCTTANNFDPSDDIADADLILEPAVKDSVHSIVDGAAEGTAVGYLETPRALENHMPPPLSNAINRLPSEDIAAADQFRDPAPACSVQVLP
jgi:hypothetical protein